MKKSRKHLYMKRKMGMSIPSAYAHYRNQYKPTPAERVGYHRAALTRAARIAKECTPDAHESLRMRIVAGTYDRTYCKLCGRIIYPACTHEHKTPTSAQLDGYKRAAATRTARFTHLCTLEDHETGRANIQALLDAHQFTRDRCKACRRKIYPACAHPHTLSQHDTS